MKSRVAGVMASVNGPSGSCAQKWTFAARLGAVTAATIGLVVVLARQAAAQGCAACYESAAASGAQGRAALRHGVLILLVPTLGLASLIIGLVYKRRNVSR